MEESEIGFRRYKFILEVKFDILSPISKDVLPSIQWL